MFAQSYPARPIRYIVPVAAGGGSDFVARTVTERWSKALNATFVVDNQETFNSIREKTPILIADGA